MDLKPALVTFNRTKIVLIGLLCGGVISSYGQQPESKPPGKIVLTEPAGVVLSRLDKDELQIVGLEYEVKTLKGLLASIQGQAASEQAAVQALQASLTGLQTQFANHYHTLTVSTPGGLPPAGWGLFDVTQHGGRTVTVGLKFTCAPGVDSRCGPFRRALTLRQRVSHCRLGPKASRQVAGTRSYSTQARKASSCAGCLLPGGWRVGPTKTSLYRSRLCCRRAVIGHRLHRVVSAGVQRPRSSIL
jgi:hypothetical protein